MNYRGKRLFAGRLFAGKLWGPPEVVGDAPPVWTLGGASSGRARRNYDQRRRLRQDEELLVLLL
jgi:hypothetical protein